ncbi:MAG: restriction endonuclease subunit S [Acidobacteriota bacterium]|nr:MAG: restriction endonuclease subunit S [Acidobacteriota bacterium]
MGEWKKYELRQVAEIFTGFPFKGDQYEMAGNLKVVRGENVTVGNLRWDTEKYWNHSTEKLEEYFLQSGDIVIGMDGSKVGHNRAIIGQNQLPLILAQRVARLRAKSNFDQNFLWYQIFNEKFVDYVEAIHTGTSIPHISPTQIGDFEFRVPVLVDEQKAIAEVLGSLDDKIDLLHRQNKTLESLAQTLFRQLFIEEADDRWETKTVGDVAVINELSIDKDYEHKDIEYLDTGSITDNIVSEYQYLSLEEAPSRAKRIVKNNDIIISTVRPIHRHYGLLKSVNPNTIVSTGFCVISCTKIDPHFLYIFLTQKEMTEYFDVIAEGSTSAYPSLKPSDISSVDFKMPPPDLLKKFSDYASDAWQKLEINKAQIQSLSSLRDQLLPKLMSGKLSPM